MAQRFGHRFSGYFLAFFFGVFFFAVFLVLGPPPPSSIMRSGSFENTSPPGVVTWTVYL